MKKSNKLYTTPTAEVIEIQAISIFMGSAPDGGNGSQSDYSFEEDD